MISAIKARVELVACCYFFIKKSGDGGACVFVWNLRVPSIARSLIVTPFIGRGDSPTHHPYYLHFVPIPIELLDEPRNAARIDLGTAQ
jgi:hypothetical protein